MRKKQTKNNVKDISVSVPDMNDSMIRHVMGEESVAIREIGCTRNGEDCIYINDCDIKRYFDSFLWNTLELNTVCTVEINYCGHFSSSKVKTYENIPKLQVIKSEKD